MVYQHIHSEVLLKKLIDMQNSLLERDELPEIMEKESRFLRTYAHADYIGISFLKRHELYELECKMGEDHGLIDLLKTTKFKTEQLFTYVQQMKERYIIIKDDDLCKFFRFQQKDCQAIKNSMKNRKLLLHPLQNLQHKEWAGIVFMLLNSNEEIGQSLEVCALLGIVVSPFYDNQTGIFSQRCVHENHRFNKLSDREREIAKSLLQGLTQAEVAEKESLSINTIKTHIKNIYQKYDVTNRTSFINQFLKR